MKKFFSLVAIAAVAATMFTSCDKKDDPTPPVAKAKLVLSAASNTVAVDAEGTFTVTSDIAAPEAIVVTVKSSAEATLTVDPASVTIPKGEKTATGKFKGVADGKATITITSTADVTISTPSVEITVGAPAPVSKIVTGTLSYTTDPTTDNDGDGFMLPSGDTDSGEYQIAFLWVTNKLTSATASSSFNTVIDNYGAQAVGTVSGGRIQLSLIEEGVDVSTLTFADNTGWTSSDYWVCPVLYSDTYTALAGKSGYVVMKFAYADSDNGIDEGEYIGWVKVEVSATGAVTTSDFALNCGTGTFKTGQKS